MGKTERGSRTAQDLLASDEFRRLVSKRWAISVVLTLVLFVIYYGYIWLIAADPAFMARRIGEGVTTLGIPLGVAVIVISWVLTAVYVAWANRVYDGEVRRLRDQIKH